MFMEWSRPIGWVVRCPEVSTARIHSMAQYTKFERNRTWSFPKVLVHMDLRYPGFFETRRACSADTNLVVVR